MFKSFLKLFTFVLLIGLCFSLYLYIDNKKQVGMLEDQLEGFVSLPISIDGEDYYIEDGKILSKEYINVFKSSKILRIAHASILARLNPIFAIEGNNFEDMEKSIIALENSLYRISDFLEYDESKIIKERFYPIDFLKSLNETEKLRQNLIYEPNYEYAEFYYEKLEKTIDFYILYIDDLVDQLEKIKIFSKNQTLHYVGGTTTLESYILMFNEVKLSAINKKQELKIRQECLGRISSHCPLMTDVYKEMFEERKISDSEEMSVPSTVIDNKKIIKESFRQNNKNALEANSIDFSTFAIRSSPCFSEFPIAYYQPQLSVYDEISKVFRLSLLNDLYFLDTSDSLLDYVEEMKKSGLRYLYQPVSNLYVCPLIAEDFSKIISADTINKMIKNISFLGDTPDFVDADVIYEGDLLKYIEKIKSMFREKGEKRLAKEIGLENVLYLEKLISIYNQKSPRFNELVGNVIVNNLIVSPIFIEKTKVNLDLLFLRRTYPTTLLFFYNKSFFEEPPKFMLKNNEKISLFGVEKMISYNDYLKSIYRDDITKEIVKGLNLMWSVFDMNLLNKKHNPQQF